MTDIELVEQILEHIAQKGYSLCYVKALRRALKALKNVDEHKLISADSVRTLNGEIYVKWSAIEEVFE